MRGKAILAAARQPGHTRDRMAKRADARLAFAPVQGWSAMHRPRLTLALAAVVCAAACATNPATGKKQLMLVSEAQEIAMGRAADQEAVAAYGLYPDPKSRPTSSARPASPRPSGPTCPGASRRSTTRRQRLRPARRLHLRHPRHHGAPALRGRARGGHRARDRARDRPPLGEPDEQAAARDGRAARRDGRGARAAAVRRPGPAGPGSAVPEVRARRRERGRRARPALHGPRGLRAAGDARGVRRARPRDARGGRRRLPDWLSTHPSPGNRAARIQSAIAAGLGRGHDHEPRGVPAAARRDGLRREPARGLLPGERLLPPRAALPPFVPARLHHAATRSRRWWG